ncbi:MAG: hypothetical protein GX319_02240 [Clostridiales bacterium]|jgi:methyl-accepting chemotaxis protein|nr:hypothetical protein [Clostridiales bacterium]
MKWYYNLKIGTKLILGFIVVALLAGIIGFYGITNMNIIKNNTTIIYDNVTVPLEQLANISITFQRQRVITRDIVLYSNLEDRQYRADVIKDYDQTIEELVNSYEKTIVDNAGHQLLNILNQI